jgi:hypothetical protein
MYYFYKITNIMAASTVDKELVAYSTQLNESQKRALLEMVKTFLQPKNEPVGTITIEQ